MELYLKQMFLKCLSVYSINMKNVQTSVNCAAARLKLKVYPPTNGALDLHISRAHYVSMLWKNSLENIMCLPPVEEFGWSIDGNGFFDPLRCNLPPAPQAITNLVKCGCKTGCPINCKCRSNKIGCTELCHCSKSSCRNMYNIIDAFDGENEDVK